MMSTRPVSSFRRAISGALARLPAARSAATAVAIAGASFACDEDAVQSLRDTEGRTFAARCVDGACSYTRVKADSVSKERTELALWTRGRVVGICDVKSTGSAAQSPTDCRALVCSADAECPPLHGEAHGQCLNGVCIEPANPIDSSDAVLLCLAGTGLGRSKPQQVERYALALNCGTPCRIPTPCQQL